ncbi:hypothetical protein LEP1GSC121_1034 [Leptospira borgpetersenii serovar Castellonis str. 200801910]|nr:hypothetical protein LEP1GSC121_1034 [Leptospira borgpetersenii serovar Castellonis str. 200801910]
MGHALNKKYSLECMLSVKLSEFNIVLSLYDLILRVSMNEKNLESS